MKLKTTKLTSFDNLELKEGTFQKVSFPDHIHDAVSIGVIRKGVEKVMVNGDTLTAPTGSIVVINAFEVHSNAYFNEDAWTYNALYLNQDLIRYFLQKAGIPNHGPLRFSHVVSDADLLSELIQLHDAPSDQTEKRLANLVCTLATRFSQKEEQLTKAYRADEMLVQEMIGHFDHAFLEGVSVEALALQHGLSSSKLIRAFKAHTGLTPIKYITILRLDHSKKLILQGMPIVEVALESGFYDQSHYSHCFQRYFGISPLQYRKNSSVI